MRKLGHMRRLLMASVSTGLVSGLCFGTDARAAQDEETNVQNLPAVEVVAPPPTARRAPSRPVARTAASRRQAHGPQDLRLPDLTRRLRQHRCRQDPGEHQCGRSDPDQAHRLAEHCRCASAIRPRRQSERSHRQSVPAEHRVSRLRRLASGRHAAGTCRLSERRTHQRSVLRHRQLGLDPYCRDPLGHRRDQ